MDSYLDNVIENVVKSCYKDDSIKLTSEGVDTEEYIQAFMNIFSDIYCRRDIIEDMTSFIFSENENDHVHEISTGFYNMSTIFTATALYVIFVSSFENKKYSEIFTYFTVGLYAEISDRIIGNNEEAVVAMLYAHLFDKILQAVSKYEFTNNVLNKGENNDI